MYHLWHTGHQINHKVMTAFKLGMVKISETHEGYPLKHVSQWSGQSHNVSYGFLRGTDRIFKQSEEYWEIDRGYIGAGHFGGYYRITMNGLRVPYNPLLAAIMPLDRWRHLRVGIKPWQRDGEYVLVVPPSHAVMEYYGVGEDWAEKVSARLHEQRIRYRVRNKTGAQMPLRDDLAMARCVVTYNSNVAVDALLAGVPAVSESLDISEWNGLGLDDVIAGRELCVGDRVELFNWLAWNQFTLDEMRTGIPWRVVQSLQKYEVVPDGVRVRGGEDG